MMNTFLFLVFLSLLLLPFSTAQISPVETNVLLQVQQLLEYPRVLQGWNNWTNFCNLPPSPSVTIVCSGNHVTELTSFLENFHRLERFDVSSNKLSGPIPSFLFSLQSILYLNLAMNHLNGELATNVSCNKKLIFVDISSNFLIGKLPSCISTNSLNRTVISVWNCLSYASSQHQHRHSFCQKEALAVKPEGMDQKKQTTMNLGAVLGIIGATVGTVATIGILILIIFRRIEASKARKHKSDGFIFDQNPARGSPLVDSRHRPQTMRRMATFGLPPYQIFTWEEIQEATNNLDASNLVGEDSQGQIYKACLTDGSSVLIKCLKVKQKHSPQTVKQFKESISKLRHQNIVSVLGHCTLSYIGNPNLSTVFVVQENISNGSLRDHLKDWRKREVLKWPQRMGIIIGIAKGIQYLHRGIAPRHFGNNLKIKNILLDENLTPKISSYNLPLPTKVGQESPLDREVISSEFSHDSLFCNSENTEKDDIYQFGVILLQVVTGKLFNSRSEIVEMKLQLEMNEAIPESPPMISNTADPSLHGTFAYGSLKTAIQITLDCLGEDSITRPSIEDVLWHLQYSIQVQEGWTSSGNLDTNM